MNHLVHDSSNDESANTFLSRTNHAYKGKKRCEPIGTNAYCLLNDDLKQVILVDAPLGSFEWSNELCRKYNYELVAVLLTHGHWDHILDAHLFNEQRFHFMVTEQIHFFLNNQNE